ncbi:LETM1 domain-containing protein 1 [Vespa velutina]|uniref:LETM1 domain-containing protein 1 n=1 Tax=Vespa velutina TaxID=202808 RepID=UPI001FB360EE|nr:LETM1 domain-containing protein 1 [Vespa velutina]
MHKAISRAFFYGKHNSICFLYNPVQRYVIKIENRDGKKGKVSNLKDYWFGRYISYLKKYVVTLDKNFPKMMVLYRTFSNGIKDLYSDSQTYISIVMKQNVEGLNNLTRQEIQLAYTMPKDLIKIFPVILTSLIPFSNYVIIPLAYFFPRQLLTHHFWTPEQKASFMLHFHKKRFKYSRPLFYCMQNKVNYINNELLKIKWNGIIACLGSGEHPTIENVLSCITIFASSPYSINTLEHKYMKKLLAIHGLSIWTPFRRRRLIERGILLKRMDNAIVKEGGVDNMSIESLCWALSFRGLNPVNMSMESMKDWLEQWLKLSASVDNSTLSLLLHSPIFLAYNHSNNLHLLYK